jgi:hypothetical protein
MYSTVNESDRLPPLAQLAVASNNMLKRTSQTVLYRSNSTGGARPGLGTKPRRLTPAQQFLETGLRRQASFFGAACEKISGATLGLADLP